jgi:hypothetical protein
VLQTLEFDYIIHNVSFSDDGTVLDTDRWPLRTVLSLSNSAFSRVRPSQSAYIGEHWVSQGAEKAFWLPFEYRPGVTAIHGGTVGFRYSSGRVLIMEFTFQSIS